MMSGSSKFALRPGEIRLDLLPIDWPLTPLGANKDPYVRGWQDKPFSKTEIEAEITTGDCKAIGLIGGPAYNHPYGFVWVDVDGPTVYELVKEISNETDFDVALPATLTICSGKAGRERKLYKLHRDKQKHFVRNKYTWHASGNKEKLEILWSRHQGVLMGLHPETEGYYTAEGMGFEWIDKLPDFPEWLLNLIINKNVKQGIPAKETTRFIGPGFALNAEVSLDRDIKLAQEAMWALPPEVADDYDIWITVGQSLHSLDESLLDEWDNWSRQSEKYKDGECHRRWLSFSKGGGRKIGSLIHVAQEHGWKQSEDYKALPVDDSMLDHVSKLLAELEEDLAINAPTAMPTLTQTKTATWTTSKKKETTKSGKDQKPRNPSADIVSDVLLQMYKGNLLYSQQQGAFFSYEYHKKGLWSQLSDHEIKGDIKNRFEMVKEDLLPNGYSMNLINDVVEQLKISVIFDDWYEGKDLLLFTNGILNLHSKELMPFNRDLYITQQLPYEYDPAATCEPIVKWLKHTQFDNWQRTQVLRAWLMATLLSTYEIQKFIEIVGPGKSGKSTYANLAVALVGKKNVYSTDFENLEKNRFEAASYMGKKLLLFQDADRWGGSVSRLKAITGNDWIRAERKYQNENYEPFQFKGLVIVTANEAIQSTDYTSGLARRRLTVPFDRPFTGGQAEQRELIKFNTKGEPQGEFAPLLPGLVNWLLDMTEAEMREYLMETNQKVEFFKKYSHTQNLRSNSILDWMEHRVVYEPGVSAAVGFVKPAPQGSSHLYTNQDKWLYASYAEFCKQCNVNVMSRNRFEPLFLDICRHQLNLNVFSKRNTKGMRVFNVVVRDSDPKYEGYPSAVTVAANPDKFELDYGVKIKADPNARMEDIDENMFDG